ncbi:hypothetical protein [Cellulomonas fengjieae]|uniref:Uncharacterized protein n=1 Tax=Cellulomonas fengjieae TaxID=2819978 RepID=A0ABS3SK60_9CELL|nr:hypothetical protein [Cellulomonas fengjieae]MBO3086138.1 hypothetical protein [Cellulomonas fengjieae]QVI65800.1 hypothetical protein KG102_17275 [Cellulomonas fengjieae]
MIRTVTAHDDLELERVGYERGAVLLPSAGRPDAHRYRVDTAGPLVADGLVLLEESPGSYRFLDSNRVPLTVRDLRRFRILVKLAEATPSDRVPAGVTVQPGSAELVDLRDDALDNGLLDGVDFAVGAVGSALDGECITFDDGPDGFVVGYRDAGTTSRLFASRSFAQARAVFLDEACWLGAERGRGTYVGREQAVGTEGWTSVQVVSAYARRLLDGA